MSSVIHNSQWSSVPSPDDEVNEETRSHEVSERNSEDKTNKRTEAESAEQAEEVLETTPEAEEVTEAKKEKAKSELFEKFAEASQEELEKVGAKATKKTFDLIREYTDDDAETALIMTMLISPEVRESVRQAVIQMKRIVLAGAEDFPVGLSTDGQFGRTDAFGDEPDGNLWEDVRYVGKHLRRLISTKDVDCRLIEIVQPESEKTVEVVVDEEGLLTEDPKHNFLASLICRRPIFGDVVICPRGFVK